MRITLIIVLLHLCKWALAQNIVPNSGFEEIQNCPQHGGSIYWAFPWNSSSNSPDLYNICGLNGYTIPMNRNGTQDENSGQGYAGFATYSEDWHGLNIREFLKCPLNYPLVGDNQYYVEFHVSQADSLQFATHNIGVTFTTVDTGQFGELLCWPDCPIYYENTSANPLSSKTEWMKVSGTFTALGGERYIHIGNFRTDNDSEIEFVGGGTDPNTVWNQAYYYIDEVWLSHIDSADYVGVNEVDATGSNDLKVYPNPNDGTFNIMCSLAVDGMTTVTLFDNTGRKVHSSIAMCNGQPIAVSGLSAGLYQLVLEKSGFPVLNERIVILKP